MARKIQNSIFFTSLCDVFGVCIKYAHHSSEFTEITYLVPLLCSLNWRSFSMITPAPANKICHILPCSIDYDGMAPIHVYFQPSQVQAQFRGRKLLAQPPVAVQGRVMGGRGSNPRGNLTFTQIQEWHHLHDPLLLPTANSRVETARTWCQVARAVHDEIPVDD